jgi:transcriptional regulator with XRE-family HTH domain
MNCEQELTALREAIRNERKNKRITQEELAEMLEVSPTHVKHIESGHRKPSIEILFELAKILNISLDEVVFPKNRTPNDATRGKIERLLDVSDESSLQFILSVLEALREKEQTGIK